MAKKKLSRKELLKNTDEFLTLSGKVVLYFNQHMHQLRLIGIGLAAIAVLYLSVWGYMKHTNKKGQAAYNVAYDALVQSLQSEETDEEGMKKSEGLFEAVINDYGMSRAADLALAQVGHAKFTNKQYDEAIDYYQEFSNKASGNEAYKTLTLLGLAACYEAKGDMKEAVSILDGIIKASDNPFRENAMLDLERVYRLDNQPEKADEILKTFAKEYANSPFYPMVKARI
ncbi:MAG: tetratricopeptide repeat protein [Deltaproteobacteria bacterium]|jgi:predicted negative regulator of RcsB-dependent stress response|nr:tetratricopeptide repeat protein [Deltaproteobacteria bacterium]